MAGSGAAFKTTGRGGFTTGSVIRRVNWEPLYPLGYFTCLCELTGPCETLGITFELASGGRNFERFTEFDVRGLDKVLWILIPSARGPGGFIVGSFATWELGIGTGTAAWEASGTGDGMDGFRFRLGGALAGDIGGDSPCTGTFSGLPGATIISGGEPEGASWRVSSSTQLFCLS